tara:strand:+ start:28861 stop:31134 length:2274 start_codon:yes stop_codon:yes gene_type:complete
MLSSEEKLDIIKGALASGHKGSIGDLINQQEAQASGVDQIADTPAKATNGLRGQPEGSSMSFPNSSGDFNTMGMTHPIDMKKVDKKGNVVASYESVPPGIENIPMGDDVGTVIETPGTYKKGGFKTGGNRMQYAGPRTDGPRVEPLNDAEMSLKIYNEANSGNTAAQRMIKDEGQRMQIPEVDGVSTHYMSAWDNYAVPTVQEKYPGGPLTYDPNPAPSKKDFKFDTDEQADFFAKHYKTASASKAFHRKGGVRSHDTYLSKRFATGGDSGEEEDDKEEDEPNWFESTLDYVGGAARDVLNNVVPSNARQLISDVTGIGSQDIDETTISDRESQALRDAIGQAGGGRRGVIEYNDYQTSDHKNDDVGGTFSGSFSPLFKYFNPSYSMKTTLGQASYKKNRDGTYSVTDQYNFNDATGEGFSGVIDDFNEAEGLDKISPYRILRSVGRNYGSGEGEGGKVNINVGQLAQNKTGGKRMQTAGFNKPKADSNLDNEVSYESNQASTEGKSDFFEGASISNALNWRKNIAKNLNPYGYQDPVSRIWSAVVQDKESHQGKKAIIGEKNESKEERTDLMHMMLGLDQENDSILESEWKPTEDDVVFPKDSDAKFYSSPVTEERIRNSLLSPSAWDTDSEGNNSIFNVDNLLGKRYGKTLGNFSITKGEDDEGSYLEYKDIWDLNPLSEGPGVVRNIENAIQSAMGIEPTKLYGRVYYDPKTGKTTKTEKKEGEKEENVDRVAQNKTGGPRIKRKQTYISKYGY